MIITVHYKSTTSIGKRSGDTVTINKGADDNKAQPQKESVLDYCICSPQLHTKMDKFEVLKNEDMNSDHLPFKVDLNFSTNCVQHTQVADMNEDGMPNRKKADWPKYAEYLPSNIPNNLDYDIEGLNKFITDSILTSANLSIARKKLF